MNKEMDRREGRLMSKENHEDLIEIRKIFDKFGKYFVLDEENNEDRKSLTKITLSMMGDVKGKRILDAGCGPGKEVKILSEMGAEVVGMDISKEMLKIAKKNCEDVEANFILGNIEQTEFPDHELDIIISLFSILFKKNLESLLKEFHRILKKGGELYIVVPHPTRKMVVYTKNYFDSGKHWEQRGKLRVFNYYRTMEEYINSLVDAGFQIKEIREPKPVKRNCIEFVFPHFLIIKCVA
jgi:ubiquinone/menaquinone biosynthesis C-methylase UbiE